MIQFLTTQNEPVTLDYLGEIRAYQDGYLIAIVECADKNLDLSSSNPSDYDMGDPSIAEDWRIQIDLHDPVKRLLQIQLSAAWSSMRAATTLVNFAVEAKGNNP